MNQPPYGSQNRLPAAPNAHVRLSSTSQIPFGGGPAQYMGGMPFGARVNMGEIGIVDSLSSGSSQHHPLYHQQDQAYSNRSHQHFQQQPQQIYQSYGLSGSTHATTQIQKQAQHIPAVQSSYLHPQQQHSQLRQQNQFVHQQSQPQQQAAAFGQQIRFGQQATLLAPIRSIVPVSSNMPAAVAAASPVGRKTLACLALADYALKNNQIMLGLRCLHAALITKEMPLRMTAQTCLNIAKISWRYLHNAQYAKSAAQEALKISQTMVRQSTSMTQSSYGPVLELEATLLLCRILISERSYTRALQLLNGALDTSKSVASVAHNNQQWYCQIKSQQIVTLVKAGDRAGAQEALNVVCDYCTHNGLPYLKVLYTLARAQLSVQNKRYQDALNVIQECHTMLNTAATVPGGGGSSNGLHPILREELRCYGFMLSVLIYLSYGRLKAGKPLIEQMEKCVNDLEALKAATVTASSSESGGPLVRRYSEAFQFLDDDLYLPLYFAVVAQYHLKNGFASHTDRYAAEAMQIFCPNLSTMLAVNPGKLAPFRSPGSAYDWPLRNSNGLDLRIHLHSLLAAARLMLSRTSSALDDVAAIVRIAQRSVHSSGGGSGGGGVMPLSDDMQARVHCMLAMITMSINFNEVAEGQLNAALRTCTDHEWWLYMSLTMAIVYLRSAKFHDFITLAHARLKPEFVTSQCLLLRNSVNTIQSALAFVETRVDDARKFLTEGVTKSANEESITRMSAVSLCQLGWYAVQLGNREEALQMANASYGMATKFPDLGLQFWALSLMRDVFRQIGDYPQHEQCNQYIKTLTDFVNDEYSNLQQRPEYKLLEWLDGPTPPPSTTQLQQTSHDGQHMYLDTSGGS